MLHDTTVPRSDFATADSEQLNEGQEKGHYYVLYLCFKYANHGSACGLRAGAGRGGTEQASGRGPSEVG